MEKPIILRVLMSRDWSEAFRLVWFETFKAALDKGVVVPRVDVVGGDLTSWPERRRACLHLGRRCAEDYRLPELACAWRALAVDPTWRQDGEAAKAFVPVNFALGDAIIGDPSLLDDLDLARTVTGWRFVEALCVCGPEQDPIVVGRGVGARLDVDKDELFRWARKWSEEGGPV